MKELALTILGLAVGLLIGLCLGSSNTIDTQKHHEVCAKYNEEIQNYHDYVIAIEKYDVMDSIKEHPGVSVLRNKLNLEEEPKSYENSYSRR